MVPGVPRRTGGREGVPGYHVPDSNSRFQKKTGPGVWGGGGWGSGQVPEDVMVSGSQKTGVPSSVPKDGSSQVCPKRREFPGQSQKTGVPRSQQTEWGRRGCPWSQKKEEDGRRWGCSTGDVPRPRRRRKWGEGGGVPISPRSSRVPRSPRSQVPATRSSRGPVKGVGETCTTRKGLQNIRQREDLYIHSYLVLVGRLRPFTSLQLASLGTAAKKSAVTEVADTCRMIQPILKHTYVPYMYSLYRNTLTYRACISSTKTHLCTVRV